MKVLGITGGVGSGKSAVLSYLAKQDGIVVYEADKIAQMEQEAGTKCFNAIVDYFGNEIVTEDGQLNRRKLGEIVFQDESQLEKLNEIVHPLVREKIQELMEEHEAVGMKLFVLEAAILLESNYEELCDEVWYIYCQEKIRMERLKASRNYTEELFQNIISKQMPEGSFRKKCSVVIDNSFDENHLQREITEKLSFLLG